MPATKALEIEAKLDISYGNSPGFRLYNRRKDSENKLVVDVLNDQALKDLPLSLFSPRSLLQLNRVLRSTYQQRIIIKRDGQELLELGSKLPRLKLLSLLSSIP